MATAAIQNKTSAVASGAKRFYRPELDALRLLAFLCVFITHGPRLLTQTEGIRLWAAQTYNSLADGLVSGLSLFFFLSSFLITELLLREQQKTGSIHLRSFYIRRILRIWPLYYFAVLCAVIAPLLVSPETQMSRHQLLAFILLVGYLAKTAHGNPFGILWSISVEELFYLVWPLLAKGGKSWLTIGCILIIPMSLVIDSVFQEVWYNPFVHFIFFASGALLAIVLKTRLWQPSLLGRLSLFVLAMGVWYVRPMIFWHLPMAVASPIAFSLATVGCIAVFLAFFDLKLPSSRLTRATLYLGGISYGLYVFHLFFYRVVEHWLTPSSSDMGVRSMVAVQSLTLVLTVGVASMSYRWLERPFLLLKDRFAPIKTRPVD